MPYKQTKNCPESDFQTVSQSNWRTQGNLLIYQPFGENTIFIFVNYFTYSLEIS